MATARIIRLVSAILLLVAIIGGISVISNADREYNENKKYLEYASVNGGYHYDLSALGSLYNDYPAYAEGRGNKAVEAQARKKYAIIGMVALGILSLLGFGFASIIASNAKTAEATAQMLRQNSVNQHYDQTRYSNSPQRQRSGEDYNEGSGI